MTKRWIENVLTNSLALQPGERVVVMTDRSLREAGAELATAARQADAASVVQTTLPESGVTFSLVPTSFVQEVRQADVLISMRAELDLMEEDPHIRAAMSAFREAGRGRWASLAQVDQEVLEHELSANWDVVAAEAERLRTKLARGSKLHLTTAAGTDLKLSYAGRPLHMETGLIRTPGAFGNLPPGEVYVAPQETSAEGRLVVDLCLGDLWMDNPVTLTFVRGRVVAMDGGWAADELRSRLGEDDWAWTIGEFGLGANPFIRRRGRVAHDEKALGTAHVALGSNRSFGGMNPAETHYDCVLAEPQITVQT